MLYLSDAELLKRIRQAGEMYRKIYGHFPSKIGVHYARRHALPLTIVFLEMHKIPIATVLDDLSKPIPAATRVSVPIETVAGEDVSQHEVYFPHPYDPSRVVSFPGLQKMLTTIKE